MPAKRYTIRANFPVLGEAAHQEIDVMAGSWVVAIGKAAKLLRRLPVMSRRRVTALSIVLEQREGTIIPVETPAPQDAIRFPVDSVDSPEVTGEDVVVADEGPSEDN